MHRLSMSQQPHVDYHTPIGWLTYGLPWLGHLALDLFDGALEFGGAVMLAILLPLAAVVLNGRASSAPTRPGLLLLFALTSVAAVPWPLSESSLASTQVAHWAAHTAAPRSSAVRRQGGDHPASAAEGTLALRFVDVAHQHQALCGCPLSWFMVRSSAKLSSRRWRATVKPSLLSQRSKLVSNMDCKHAGASQPTYPRQPEA